MPNELLIKGGHVVTMDPALGDQPDSDVLVRDGVIVEVRPGLETSAPDAEVIEAKGRLVIPGLVDTHRHVWQGAIGGFTPQMTGAGYGPAVLTGIAPKHSADDVYAGTLWGALQALDAGITTIADWAHNLQSASTCRRGPARPTGVRDPGLLPLRWPRTGKRRSEPAAPRRRSPDARRAISVREQWAAADGHGATRAVLHHSGT